jgi:hypothetical protein
VEQLRSALKKKDELLLHEQEVSSKFAHKLAQFEELEAQDRFYDEKMREK